MSADVLEYLIKNKTLYDVTPLKESWFGLEEFQDHHLVSPLSPVARLLLTSDGSMTQMLESLLLSDISMAIERQDIISSAASLSGMDSACHGEKALAREAWLTAAARPLVYAHSLLFAADSKSYSLDAIRDVTEPLGKMLRQNNIKTSREGHRMGRVKSPEISKHLDLSSDEKFWARYYSLDTDTGLKGVIFEVFSPELFEI
ncbi:MAG: chorismate pyruvate-lyase family protein [bacterium]|nr:chorismate pyruvate-lyase family protein [bacterium]